MYIVNVSFNKKLPSESKK